MVVPHLRAWCLASAKLFLPRQFLCVQEFQFNSIAGFAACIDRVFKWTLSMA